jgi:RNA polymerase sigma-70 factor (ECF subfamily)
LDADHRDEQILIARAITGDKAAFGTLYDRYFAQIFRYLQVRCGNVQDAEDLAENVFIMAWEKLPSFKSRRGQFFFRAWLFRIGHNMMIDRFRKGNREDSIEEMHGLPTQPARIEEGIVGREVEGRMLEAINSLDERAQQVITARFVSGLTHEETAHMLQTSAGNVRIIQFRALKQLKQILMDDETDE